MGNPKSISYSNLCQSLFENFCLNYNMNKRAYSLAELLKELQAAEGLFKTQPRVNVAERSSSSKRKAKKKGKKPQGQVGVGRAFISDGFIKRSAEKT